jgi:hypothetical protein
MDNVIRALWLTAEFFKKFRPAGAVSAARMARAGKRLGHRRDGFGHR